MTTGWGAAGSGADRYRLPRFTPWDRGADGASALRMLGNLRRARRSRPG
ncbi:MAG: hypothetical protein MZW92_21355 [Comamonadaceae bacterium]|nr:hypothetical protein [Comamonadaceae bacterium]